MTHPAQTVRAQGFGSGLKRHGKEPDPMIHHHRSLAYARHFYGVPARRGMRVRADGKLGTITMGWGAHIRIRLDGEKHSGCWHPTWRIDYDPFGKEAHG